MLQPVEKKAGSGSDGRKKLLGEVFPDHFAVFCSGTGVKRFLIGAVTARGRPGPVHQENSGKDNDCQYYPGKMFLSHGWVVSAFDDHPGPNVTVKIKTS